MSGLPLRPAGPMLPADTFAGTTVLVTGGGTGLGKAIAVEFGRAGARVAVASRKEEHRAEGIAALEAVGAKVAGVELDVRDPDAISAAFDRVADALGPVSILINNAAANFPVAADALSPNGWRAVEQIVLDGTFFCSQELHRRLAADSAAGGSIVNIVSTAATTGGPGMVHSAAAKAGVVSLTKTLAVEWATHGIRVNAVSLGTIRSSGIM